MIAFVALTLDLIDVSVELKSILLIDKVSDKELEVLKLEELPSCKKLKSILKSVEVILGWEVIFSLYVIVKVKVFSSPFLITSLELIPSILKWIISCSLILILI